MRKNFDKSTALILIFFIAVFNIINAQENLSGFNDIDDYYKKSNNLIHKFGIDIRPGYVFPTNIFFKGDNAKNAPINTTVSTHLKYSFQFGKDTFYGRNYPNTSQGIGLGYNTFFNKSEIGNPVALYVFQNSRICSLSENLSLDYEWNFGVSAGWSKYEENYNEFNRVVGSDFNAYINLGLMFNWKISSVWNLTAGVGLNHFSNGNTKYPNAGVNTIEGKIGIIKTRGDNIQGNKYIQKNKFKSYI